MAERLKSRHCLNLISSLIDQCGPAIQAVKAREPKFCEFWGAFVDAQAREFELRDIRGAVPSILKLYESSSVSECKKLAAEISAWRIAYTESHVQLMKAMRYLHTCLD